MGSETAIVADLRAIGLAPMPFATVPRRLLRDAADEIDLLREVVAAAHVRLRAGRGPESPSHWRVDDVVLSARAAEAVQRALDSGS